MKNKTSPLLKTPEKVFHQGCQMFIALCLLMLFALTLYQYKYYWGQLPRQFTATSKTKTVIYVVLYDPVTGVAHSLLVLQLWIFSWLPYKNGNIFVKVFLTIFKMGFAKLFPANLKLFWKIESFGKRVKTSTSFRKS